MDNKSPSDHFRPAIVVARQAASAYDLLATDRRPMKLFTKLPTKLSRNIST